MTSKRAEKLLDKWVIKEEISFRHIPNSKPKVTEYLHKWSFLDLVSFSHFCAEQEAKAVEKVREEAVREHEKEMKKCEKALVFYEHLENHVEVKTAPIYTGIPVCRICRKSAEKIFEESRFIGVKKNE